jgi:hypothetical protein
LLTNVSSSFTLSFTHVWINFLRMQLRDDALNERLKTNFTFLFHFWNIKILFISKLIHFVFIFTLCEWFCENKWLNFSTGRGASPGSVSQNQDQQGESELYVIACCTLNDIRELGPCSHSPQANFIQFEFGLNFI